MPLCPYGLNAQGLLSRLAVGANVTRGLANGSGLPWSRSSSGLGSNVSTCDGPPFMNRKITRFARGVKWGRLGARGSNVGPAGVDVVPRAVLSASIDASAK